MTPKERLQTILDGGIPDVPPHFELVFQIEDSVFGIDRPSAIDNRDLPDRETMATHIELNIELQTRLVETYHWAAVYPVAFSTDAITRLKKTLGARALVMSFEWDGVFWMPPGNEIMDFVVMLYEQPDELHRLAREKCDKAKEWIKQMADAGTDFFCLAHDFGFNEGPFISPEHFGVFVTPYLTEIVHLIHDLKMKAILHSDGDLRTILGQLYATGLDGYQSVDPQGHMDIKAVREEYPDWILMGNVKSSMLQDTVEDEIRKSVQYCMTHGGIGKRYILSTSNCVFNGMPQESYHIMLDEYKKVIAPYLSQ